MEDRETKKNYDWEFSRIASGLRCCVGQGRSARRTGRARPPKVPVARPNLGLPMRSTRAICLLLALDHMKALTQFAIAMISAAGILAVVVAISPQAATVANEVSSEAYSIDIYGITRRAGNLPEQQFPTH